MIVQAVCDLCGKPAFKRDYDGLDYCQACWNNAERTILQRDIDLLLAKRVELDKAIDGLKQRLSELSKPT